MNSNNKYMMSKTVIKRYKNKPMSFYIQNSMKEKQRENN